MATGIEEAVTTFAITSNRLCLVVLACAVLITSPLPLARAQEAKPASEGGTVSDAQPQEQQKSRRGSFVGIPVPTASPTIGTGVTLMAGYIFPLSRNDKLSPPSVIGSVGLITNNGSKGLAVGTELYFGENRYHILTGYAHGDLNYDFYGTGTASGDAGLKFGLNQTGDVFFGEALRKLFWKMFVGPRVWMGTSSLAAQRSGESPSGLPPLGPTMNMRSLGFKLERETMSNRFYPTDGTWLEFGADFFSEAIGSTYTFQRYRLTFNSYHSFGDKQVLAYNLFLCSTGGDAPFFGECIFGMQNELRGYPAGRYIDRKMIATQAEYRLSLPKRLGLVAFAGMGEVASTLGSFNATNLLPSAGGGPRFQLSTKYHVNLRADFAVGKNGHTFSMGLGEAF